MQIAAHSTDLLQCSLKKKKKELTTASWTLTAVSLLSALSLLPFQSNFPSGAARNGEGHDRETLFLHKSNQLEIPTMKV